MVHSGLLCTAPMLARMAYAEGAGGWTRVLENALHQWATCSAPKIGAAGMIGHNFLVHLGGCSSHSGEIVALRRRVLSTAVDVLLYFCNYKVLGTQSRERHLCCQHKPATWKRSPAT